MTINRSFVLAGHGRSITSESSITPRFIQQTIERRPAFAKVYVCFSRIKKMLGRIDMRTRDRIYCQTIRTVRDISRDDRARIATCSLRTLTDRLKENYSIDNIIDTLYIDIDYECACCVAVTILSLYWFHQALFTAYIKLVLTLARVNFEIPKPVGTHQYPFPSVVLSRSH